MCTEKRNNEIITKSDSRRMTSCEITPEIASILLRECQTPLQRPMNELHVLKIANTITGGRWRDYNGETIKFSKSGKLIDGQHRLAAIVKSNKSIKTYIALGLDDKDIDFIDLNKKSRKIGDVYHMRGIKNACVISSAINYLWRYDNNLLLSRRTTDYPDPEESYNYYKQNIGIQNSVPSGKSIKSLIGCSIATFLHYLFCRFDTNAADIFFEQLSTGANLDNGDAILLLRARLQYNKRKDVQMKLDSYNQMALVILAWNYKRNGQKINRLRWSSKEFPTAE